MVTSPSFYPKSADVPGVLAGRPWPELAGSRTPGRASDWSCTQGWLRRRPVVDGADGEEPDDRGGAVLPALGPGRRGRPGLCPAEGAAGGVAGRDSVRPRDRLALRGARHRVQSAPVRSVLVVSTTGWAADRPPRIVQAGPLTLVLVELDLVALEVTTGFGLRCDVAVTGSRGCLRHPQSPHCHESRDEVPCLLCPRPGVDRLRELSRICP